MVIPPFSVLKVSIAQKSKIINSFWSAIQKLFVFRYLLEYCPLDDRSEKVIRPEALKNFFFYLSASIIIAHRFGTEISPKTKLHIPAYQTILLRKIRYFLLCVLFPILNHPPCYSHLQGHRLAASALPQSFFCYRSGYIILNRQNPLLKAVYTSQASVPAWRSLPHQFSS